MPPLPRLTGAETMRKLRRDGWALARIQGSHHMLQHPIKPGTIPVPLHAGRILAPGVMRSIISQAGLTVDQFIAL
jgi:predicted RNA binding protein YcfA (HicA-like mRNA interferase family)